MAENKKDLLPFYKTRAGTGNGTFFSSDDAKTTEWFGYVYDDFIGVQEGDLPALRKQIDDKYVWASRTPTHPNFTAPPSNMTPLNVRSTYFFSKASAPAFSSRATGAEAAGKAQAAFAAVSNTVTSSLQATVETAQTHLHDSKSDGRETTATASKTTKIDSKFDREWYVDSVVNR